MKFSRLRLAFPATVPVLTGYLCLGFAYGLLMTAQGFSPLWPILMSIVIYGGSIQFLAVSLLASAFDPLSAFFLSLMVNARHIFYGLTMLSPYRAVGKRKPILVALLTDETFSVVSATKPPQGVEPRDYWLFVSLLDYSYWVLGTAAGALFGNLITVNTTGMDFALTALFVVLFLEQWKKKENRPSGAVGLLGSVLALVLFGPESMVLPAMAIILVLLLAGRKRI